MCNDDHSNWDEKIPIVLMGYRASQQASTKYSPYFMLFNQHMRLPLDAELMPFREKEEDIDHDTLMQTLLESRKATFNKAETNIIAAQKKQKDTYDAKHLPGELKEGSEVLLENTKQKQQKGGKHDPLWLGPYIINKSIGKGVYQLRQTDGKVMKTTANVNRLKLYVRRSDSDTTTKRRRVMVSYY